MASESKLSHRVWFKTGNDIHEVIGKLVMEKKLQRQEGKIADVGCGSGDFCDKNSVLFNTCSHLLLSDLSQSTLKACSEKKWFIESKKVTCLQMDLRR
jgi:ubiquinone/menaquinone biosynthesis C-methylase UbiE